MFKRLLLTLSVVLLAPVACSAQEPEAQDYVEGMHYNLIVPAVRTTDPSKIEIVEFFWYGCSHCYNFEPVLSQWKKSLGEDVDFRGSPAVWNKPMELHAKAYYVAEVLGVLDTMHLILFQAMNVDKKRLASDAEVAALFAANGVSNEDFTKALNSFGVTSLARQASSRARAAKITGTPEIMVNGKYRISTRLEAIKGKGDMLKIATYLIAKERAAAGS
jgi:thiol:disulfide interchange protein DsbA